LKSNQQKNNRHANSSVPPRAPPWRRVSPADATSPPNQRWRPRWLSPLAPTQRHSPHFPWFNYTPRHAPHHPASHHGRLQVFGRSGSSKDHRQNIHTQTKDPDIIGAACPAPPTPLKELRLPQRERHQLAYRHDQLKQGQVRQRTHHLRRSLSQQERNPTRITNGPAG
jgi:hypothetical protein